jgi:hypothetical protein
MEFHAIDEQRKPASVILHDFSENESAEAGPSAPVIFLQTFHRNDGLRRRGGLRRTAYGRPFNQHSTALALSRQGSVGVSKPLRSNIFCVARLLPNAEKIFL